MSTLTEQMKAISEKLDLIATENPPMPTNPNALMFDVVKEYMNSASEHYKIIFPALDDDTLSYAIDKVLDRTKEGYSLGRYRKIYDLIHQKFTVRN